MLRLTLTHASTALQILEVRLCPDGCSMERKSMPKTPPRSSPLRRPVRVSLAASGVLQPFVFEQSPVPMWVVDAAALTFIAVNDAALSDSGYTRSELLDLTVPALCPSDDLATVLAVPLEPV